jgi:N-ethylmaleimide reductase
MSTALLFSPIQLGRIELSSRIVMSPMTRNRALGNIPNELMTRYYAQRAEAGLIVTEGTSPSADGLGYARIPGLFNDAQVRGWKLVTEAVHREGGRIFVQLMHTGRVSHPANLPAGARMIAPSSVALGGNIWVDPDGEKPAPTPEAMTAADLERTIGAYARSCELAIEAGFDGVELHAANGYLLEQFLNTASNLRTDRWGASGSLEDRLRFVVEVASRSAARIGGDRVGIRVSPYGTFNGMTSDAATEDVYEALAKELSSIGLVYMHVVDHSSIGGPVVAESIKRKLRAAFRGKLILSGGYEGARAEADLREGRADLIAFGRPFISNPRLVTRLRTNAPLRAPDQTTFYSAGEKGYTDYPAEG